MKNCWDKFGKRKYNRGHFVIGQWVFGGYERDFDRVFRVAVDYMLFKINIKLVILKNEYTLLPVIWYWIKPGTTINLDYWKAYNCLNETALFIWKSIIP